jgi:hypothetical protein
VTGKHRFEHLPLPRRTRAPAKLRGSSNPSPQAIANKAANRVAHGASLGSSLRSLKTRWQQESSRRHTDKMPVLPAGRPFLLEVDPDLDIDALRHYFDLEIVAEEEEGFVLVAGHDLDLSRFSKMVEGYSVQLRGSATLAQVMHIFDDGSQQERLRRVLSEDLLARWSSIADTDVLIVDVGISCSGTVEIPVLPERAKQSDAEWAATEQVWSQKRADAYREWDRLSNSRQDELTAFVRAHGGLIGEIIDGLATASSLPDSLTVRIRISAAGFRDLVLNFPYVFEVVEPDDVVGGPAGTVNPTSGTSAPTPLPPPESAPTVCIIDSGIQEQHAWLAPAIDGASSRSFLPGGSATDVTDEVANGGHGTRVAGAVLYGEKVPDSGAPSLPCWLQNARVLGADNQLPVDLFAPAAMREIVEHFHGGVRGTRIFNQSINADAACRQKHMSAWAAAIDNLCEERDVLFVQTVGNLLSSRPAPRPGIAEQVASGADYPDYLPEPTNRVANPGQSLQALTVGSIAYGMFESAGWRSFASREGDPSAFSRTGLGIWSVIKPEVVEFGGDALRDAGTPPRVLTGGVIAEASPALVRSTLHSGYPHGRDAAGTSFAAPKVARIAAAVQQVLPDEPSLLHRALVVQSARWPVWAEQVLADVRSLAGPKNKALREQRQAEALRIVKSLGFGLPDVERATGNTDHRVTLVTSGAIAIRAGECDIYEVPIPTELSRPGADYEVRIDVTLSYVARPRRTRRHPQRYLSTWVDWVSSRLGQSVESFGRRVRADQVAVKNDPEGGDVLPWVFQQQDNHGIIRGVARNPGTVQKDWAVVRSNQLRGSFCIAVRGHRGWSQDPDSTARYSLVVTLEVVGEEIPIYEPVRVAVEELQVEAEV